ncbi:MAG: PEP/pyruvate-binding domain-containing protein, partial [Anaerolineae bacterium]|nr:PEP/pyruvate-binding domain-containing protein [Anaerolineae bacterium]
MNHEYTLGLTEARASLATVGGKGASLARLASAGLPVPEAFYVTTAAYDRFVTESELRPRMEAILADADPDRADSLESASRAIAALFSASQTPAAIAAAIARAYGQLPGSDPAVAVRSSATAEDLPELSFAGQQETYLNIQGIEAVLEAVKRCWASLWTGRAIGYRLRHDIDQNVVSVAVVVQLLVPAEAAGILFTANPMTGARDEMVVSAAWGLGEAIVGGLVTPDTVTVEKGSLRVLSRQTAEKETMTVRVDGGTREQPVPTPLRNAPVLSDEATVELARLGARIESLYEQPMDIEWTLTDGEFAIVQARPITALPEAPVAPPQEWPLPDPKGKYMRASIVDLMPSPLSPLFATLGIDALSEGIRRLGDEYFHAPGVLPHGLMVTINGYAYMLVSYSAREWWGMLTQLLPKFPSLVRTGTRWWQEVRRPAYVRAVGEWQDCELSEMTSAELLAGARELFDAVVDHLGSLMVGTMGISAGSEGLFTSVYQKL